MLELMLLLWYEDKAQGGGRGQGSGAVGEGAETRGTQVIAICCLCRKKKKPTNASLVVPLLGDKPRMHTAFKMLADGGPEQNLTLK